MKVDDNGNIVQVQLGKDPDDESATQFKVEADNIGFFADNMMQFTAKNIGIEADNFSVTPQGHLKSQSGDIGCMHVDGTNLYVYEYNINLLPTDSDEENRHYYESQALISVTDPGIPGHYLYYQVLLRAYYDELYDALYYKYKYIGPVEQDDPWAVSWDDETLTEYELFYYYGDYWSYPHQQPPVDVKYRLYYDPQDDTIKPFIVIPELSPSKYYFKSGSYYNGKQPNQTTAVWNTDYDGSGTDLSTYSCYYGGEIGYITENIIMTKISQYIEDFKDDVSFNTDPIVTITREGLEAVMGKIGGFKITENSLYNEKNSLTDLLNEGVYIGTDGISLGTGNTIVFTKSGVASIKNLTITNVLKYALGPLTIPAMELLTHYYNESNQNGYISINAQQKNNSSEPTVTEAIRLVYYDTSNNGYGAYVGVLRGKWYADNLYGNIVSSRHAKENIKEITDEEAKKLLETKPVSFDFKDGTKDKRGLIAEEIEEIYPNLVNYPVGTSKETYEYDENEPDKVIGLDYIGFIPYLIKMVQIQQKEIDELKAEIKAMKEDKNNDN